MTISTRVLPWERMTAQQQADHLVYAHQFNAADYFPDSLIATDAEARKFFLAMSASERDAWHCSDHDPEVYPETGGSGGYSHDHDKAASVTP